jgi:hypothetical protein
MFARVFAALSGSVGFLVVVGTVIGANAQNPGAPSAADNLPIPLYNKTIDRPVRPVVSERTESRSTTVAPAPTKRTPETIAKYVGATVIDPAGKKVGQVADFVTETDGDESVTYAVVKVGKELALGVRKVLIPASRLRLKGDRLKLVAGGTSEDLNALPDYEASQYRSVARDPGVRRPAGAAPETAPDRPTTIASD